MLLAPSNIYNKEVAEELGVKIIGSRSGHMWEQIDLPRYLKGQGSPALFNPCNTAPLFYRNNYLTLHDLAFYHHPEWNSGLFAKWYNVLVPRIVKRSRHVFTVSNTIKQEIVDAYGVLPGKISITYNGISDSMMNDRCDAGKEKIILSVGSFNKRKNHHSLIRAFCDSDLSGSYRLVITGDKNKVFSETGIDEQELERNNITVLRNLSEQELVEMYCKAEIVVSLSLYEGFGIPVLEGLHHGCKVVCSDIPVYRELFAKAAVFCNATEIDSIVAAIKKASISNAPEESTVAQMRNQYNYAAAADVIVNVMTKQ